MLQDKRKEYEIPEEIIPLMEKCVAMENLRNRYVKIPFCFRLAKKSSISSESYRRKFWLKVYDLYPELRNKSVSYNLNGNVVWVNDEK